MNEYEKERARLDFKRRQINDYRWTVINGDAEYLEPYEREFWLKIKDSPNGVVLAKWHPGHFGGKFLGWYYDAERGEVTVSRIPVEKVWAVRRHLKEVEDINVSEPKEWAP